MTNDHRERPLALSDFDYVLPPELIAQEPTPARTASRLLHVDGDSLTDLAFRDLPEFVETGDLVVLNDTRVMRARLFGYKPTGGRVEALIERIVESKTAWSQIRASHMPKIGSTLQFGDDSVASVVDRNDRLFLLRFEIGEPLVEWLDAHGQVPLPPYIERDATTADAERYQTVYAHRPGAVAAPTAGLHFDGALLSALEARGAALAYVTLHVGAGTFAPVESEDLTEHRMHAEWYDIPSATAEAIESARRRGGRILAIGTTTLRALESAVDAEGAIRSGSRDTTLFITPGFRFRVVDRLLTNFHLPKSTLLMLVSAFADVVRIRRAYAHAIAQRYRFFSYGDAMLIERTSSGGATGVA